MNFPIRAPGHAGIFERLYYFLYRDFLVRHRIVRRAVGHQQLIALDGLYRGKYQTIPEAPMPRGSKSEYLLVVSRVVPMISRVTNWVIIAG